MNIEALAIFPNTRNGIWNTIGMSFWRSDQQALIRCGCSRKFTWFRVSQLANLTNPISYVHSNSLDVLIYDFPAVHNNVSASLKCFDNIFRPFNGNNMRLKICPILPYNWNQITKFCVVYDRIAPRRMPSDLIFFLSATFGLSSNLVRNANLPPRFAFCF